jgi:glycosyltransferase involved in cell wall biosynthesis
VEDRVPLTGLVICKNEERRIGACLASLAFCDELLVIDSGSTDRTVAIAQEHRARIVERPYVGQNDQKDHGRSLAKGRFVLVIDADEVVPAALAKEVRAVVDRDGDPGVDAWRIPFKNYFRRTWVRRAGYWPDHHVRLLRADKARFDRSVPVHDKVLTDGAIGTLLNPIEHYSFESLAHFLEKSGRYADGFAKAAHAQGRSAGAGAILGHTIGRFFKAYVLKGGFLEGALGLVISGLQAYEVFQKYARLWELGQLGPPGEERSRGPG